MVVTDETRVEGLAELTEGNLAEVPFRPLLFAYAAGRRSTTRVTHPHR